ncbi:MAG: response regulator [Endomicrobiales bacterium]
MKKILLVTSDVQTVASWRAALSRRGYEMDVALSGGEALGRALSGSPDLVLLGAMDIPPEAFFNHLKRDEKAARIPVLTLSAPETASPEAVLPRITAALSPRKILVAEDDRQMADILSLILKNSGYEVKMTHDGTETLREIKAFRPHLLVLDVMLPVVDGFHICQTMNEDHSFEPRPRVLIVSGRSSDWDQNLGAACGAEEYIVKPFNHDYFLKKVREIIEGMPPEA